MPLLRMMFPISDKYWRESFSLVLYHTQHLRFKAGKQVLISLPCHQKLMPVPGKACSCLTSLSLAPLSPTVMVFGYGRSSSSAAFVSTENLHHTLLCYKEFQYSLQLHHVAATCRSQAALAQRLSIAMLHKSIYCKQATHRSRVEVVASLFVPYSYRNSPRLLHGGDGGGRFDLLLSLHSLHNSVRHFVPFIQPCCQIQ